MWRICVAAECAAHGSSISSVIITRLPWPGLAALLVSYRHLQRALLADKAPAPDAKQQDRWAVCRVCGVCLHAYTHAHLSFHGLQGTLWNNSFPGLLVLTIMFGDCRGGRVKGQNPTPVCWVRALALSALCPKNNDVGILRVRRRMSKVGQNETTHRRTPLKATPCGVSLFIYLFI